MADARRISLLLLLAAASVLAQEPAPASPPAPAERRRIVDMNKFPPKKTVAGRIFMAPVRVLALPVKGVTYAIEKAPFERFVVAREDRSPGHRHWHTRFLYGGLGEGSGIGGGFQVATANLISPNVEVIGSARVTFKRYFETRTTLLLDPTGGEKRRFRLVASGRYQLRPEEDFSGIGPFSSVTDRSTYDLQERSARFGAELQPHRRVLFGAGAGYSSISIFAGKDDRFPTTQQLFTPAEVPGLRGAQLYGPYAFLELEGRDSSSDPRSGAWLGLSLGDNRSAGGERFDFMHYRLDGRAYLALGNKRRVLAVRVLGLFNDPRGAAAVPFFRMARLGDYETLRGYSSHRFYGNNAFSGNVEYRWQLVHQLRAFLFGDFGQVFDRATQLRAENLRATFGGGFEARPTDAFTFRIFVGKSPEETRVFLKLLRGF